MVQYGLHIAGQQRMKIGVLQVGGIYEVHVETSVIRDPEDTAVFVLNSFETEYPELQLNHIQVGARSITLQFKVACREALGLAPRPVSLSAAAIIIWLPTILMLIGLTAILVSMYEIIHVVPWYIWGTLLFGIIMVVWGPSLIRLPTKYT